MKNLWEEVEGIIANTTRKKAEEVAEEMRMQILTLAKNPTGRLAGSVTIDQIDRYTFDIYPTAKGNNGFAYAKVFNDGRKAIEKYPGYLHFVNVYGRDVFTHRVSGYSGSKFVSKTASKFK